MDARTVPSSVSHTSTYALEDLDGELIKGKFYRFEIQKVDVYREGHFAIHKIQKTKRGADGKISYFVS